MYAKAHHHSTVNAVPIVAPTPARPNSDPIAAPMTEHVAIINDTPISALIGTPIGNALAPRYAPIEKQASVR